jgi:hypothetical protein
MFQEPALFLSSGNRIQLHDDKNRDGSKTSGFFAFQPPPVARSLRVLLQNITDFEMSHSQT